MIFLFQFYLVVWLVGVFVIIAFTFSWTGTSYGIPTLVDTLEDPSDEDGTWIQFQLSYPFPELVNLIKLRKLHASSLTW